MTDWARSARLAAAALIRAEAATLVGIRRVIRRTTESVSGRLALIPEMPKQRAASAAITIVRETLPTLSAAVAEAIRVGRLGSKEASTDRLRVEWRAVHRALAVAGIDSPPAAVPPSSFSAPEDETEAEIAAQSYSSAWGAAMMASIWRWSESDRGTLAAVAAHTAEVVDFRARRIATTETAKAFADARDEGMGWVAERHGDSAWFPLLVKVWDAQLDRKVCPTCSELDGKQRPWGVPFPGSAEPGYVHANCRCIPVTQLLPLPMRGEDIPGRSVDDEQPREAG